MTKKSSSFRFLWVNLMRHHRTNKRKGVYGYMWWSALKIVLIYIAVVVPIILILKHLVDLNLIFQFIFQNHSNWFILSIFFISESFLGMIPPDLFVIWSSKFNDPFLLLAFLGILSYVGGIVSYLIGYWLSKRPRIKTYSEHVLNKYIELVRKWGGAFIIIAALFPFSPFSMIIIAVSLLKYPLKLYLLFGIMRIARFLIQGILYLQVLNIDTFFTTIN